MGLTNWNPPRDIMTLRDAMNRLFEDSFVRSTMLDGETRMARLPLDAYATDEEIVVQVQVPGVNPDDVEITYEGGTLTIRGETPPRLENVSYIFQEQFHGSFSRSLQLNVPIDADKIEATFENGVLTLVLPKVEAVKPRLIKAKARK
jgi:HSP20 family protein